MAFTFTCMVFGIHVLSIWLGHSYTELSVEVCGGVEQLGNYHYFKDMIRYVYSGRKKQDESVTHSLSYENALL